MALNFLHHPAFGPYQTPYEDVMRHCKDPYTKGDAMTNAHESTHQIHSELRNKSVGMGSVNAFYVMEDRCIFFREPKITLRDAANRVKREHRGPVFDTYMVDARKWWNTNPLYTVDEAVAYTNGAIVGRDYGIDGWKFEANRAKELTQYAWYAILAVEDKDADYDELDKLVEFVNWNAARNPLFGVKLL